jgi:hypothetical protein
MSKDVEDLENAPGSLKSNELSAGNAVGRWKLNRDKFLSCSSPRVCHDSVVGGADTLNGAGKPREQAKEDEIEVYRDIILHIPREQAKEDEIEV